MRKLSFVVLALFLLTAGCTPTPVPPTRTLTPLPPTDTVAAPTDTAVIPTDTAVVPTDTPEVTSTVSPTEPSTSDTATPDGSTGFIPFDQFLQSVKDARFEDYAALPGAKVRDADAFEEMRQHILTTYDGVQQTSSFILDGRYFDCITIESQPSVKLLGADKINMNPPSITDTRPVSDVQSPGDRQYIESPLTLGLKDEFGNEISCKDGSIPMARITLEALTRFPTLRDFFSKEPDFQDSTNRNNGNEPPDNDSDKHRYARGTQQVTNFGGDSWLALWNPDLKGNEFSLSQQWYVGGDGDKHQTIEGGWQRYPGHFQTDQSVLFIYWTADDYKTTGCYNKECDGFMQINKNWALGATWTHYSEKGGTQWGFEMQWKLYQNNWWLFLKGPGNYEAIGYYPVSIFNGGQLSTSAEWVKYGGETCCDSNFPEMGSGEFADQGWQKAAYQHTIFYIPHDENGGVGVWADLTKYEPSPTCYTIDITPATRGGSWGTYFFFGGPGAMTCPR